MKSTLITITCLLFLSCHQKSDKLVGNYHIVAIDDENDMELSFSLGDGNYEAIIGPTVYEACSVHDFIFVKQHPRSYPNLPDTSISMYYILPVKSYHNKNEVIGPLNENDFFQRVSEMGFGGKLSFKKYW